MKTILIADDDKDIREMATMVLTSAGYKIISAKNGNEAYELAANHNPDLILMDVMMDEIHDGFNTLQKMKKDESLKTIPVVMLTSISEKTGINFKTTAGSEFLPSQAFLEKPLEPKTLLETIAKLIQ